MSTNLDPTAPATSTDVGGWLESDYGVSGNLVSMTVHAQCTHSEGTSCRDPGGVNLANRRSALRTGCDCESEQHYVYRYDELNRLHEGRRYDRASEGAWTIAARQRYRYDGANRRVIKQTFDVSTGQHRAAVTPFPGEFEERGLVASMDGQSWERSDEAESQYSVAGARVVWKTATPLLPLPSRGLDLSHRITFAITNLIQSTSAVVDLVSGELVEAGGFYPNGAREEWLGASDRGVRRADSARARGVHGEGSG